MPNKQQRTSLRSTVAYVSPACGSTAMTMDDARKFIWHFPQKCTCNDMRRRYRTKGPNHSNGLFTCLRALIIAPVVREQGAGRECVISGWERNTQYSVPTHMPMANSRGITNQDFASPETELLLLLYSVMDTKYTFYS